MRRSTSSKNISRSTISSFFLALLLGLGGINSAYAALDVSMSVSPSYANPIFPGDITSLRITLTNSNSASAVTGTAFTDTLTGGLAVAGAGLTSYTCVAGDGSPFVPTGTVTAGIGSTSIVLAGGTVPLAQVAGASGKCDIDIEVTTVVVGVVTNTIAAGDVSGTDIGPVVNGTQAQQSITVTALNPPVITKGFSVGSIVKSDQTVTLTIVISNANNATKNLPLNTGADTPAFAIQDALPAGLAVAAAPAATSTCSGAGVAPAFAPAASDTVLTAVGGTVAAGGTCTLTVALVGTDTGGTYSKVVNNTINRTTGFGNKRGLVPAANATASLTINSLIRVGKVFAPGTISAGQQSTLTITLTNASPLNAVTLTTFTDDPIDGVGNAGYGLKVGVPTTTCAGGVVAATAGNLGITLTGGSIPASSSCTITIPYTGTLQTAGTPQSFTNTIAVGAVGTTDASIFSQSATHSVTVVDQLTVSKARIPATAAPGNPVRYTITVNNYSVAVLNNVLITDVLPGGLVAMPTNPAAPVLSGAGCVTLTTNIPALPATTGSPQFTIGTMPAGVGPSPATCVVTFWAMTPAGASGSANNIIAAGGVRDGNGAGTTMNANASAGASVNFASTATVSKVFSPNSAFEGTVSTLTVTFTNLSAQPLASASFTDNLPTNGGGLQLVVANPASASSTCAGAVITATPGASSFTMTGATIPARASNGTGANGTCTLTLKVVGPAGVFLNTLPAGALSATDTYADGTTHAVTSPGPVSASLTYTSALTTGKSFAPTVINAGGRSTVTLQLGNVGTGTLNNVSITDPLPAFMTVATPSNAYTTCGGSPVITAVGGASSAAMTGAVIPASGVCNFLFDVIGTGGGNWTNTIPIGNVTSNGGVQNVAAITSTLTNSSGGAVSVTNNTSPNSLTAPGQVSVLTLTITNSGSIALTSLNLTDYFTNTGLISGTATGMQVASTPNASTTCVGGIATAAADGTSLTLSGASLAAAASCTVSVNVTLITTGTVQNTVPAGAIGTSQGISNTTLTVTSLSAGANIGVTKLFTPSVIKPGDRSRLRITFINPVSLAITNLTGTDNLPGGVTVPAGANPTTTCAGATVSAPTVNQVTVTGGSMAPAAAGVSTTCYAEIDVTAPVAGTYNNLIAVADVSGTIGAGVATNPVAAPATLQVRNPVVIAKAFAPATVSPGTPSTVTITLTNSNTVPLTGAVLADNLPANLSVALVPNASTTCAGGIVTAAASATSVVLTGATIPASGSCTVQFNAVSNIAASYVNTIPAGNLATVQGVTNEDPATDTLKVTDPPTVNKQFSPTSIPANGTSTLTIVLGNTNTAAATLTSALTDTLPTTPGNIVVATPNGLAGTCTLGSVTATAGSGLVRYANGAQIPAGGCSISVNVTGTLDGTYNNFIAAGALTTTLGNNVQPANANLVISPLGFIAGRVFKDNNLTPNGTYDVGTDTTLANITLNLTGTNYGADGLLGGGDDSAVSLSTTTDALGNYAFVGLNPGNYTVTEPVQPAGTANGITTASAIAGGGGGTPGTATGTGVTPSVVSGIILLKDGTGKVANSANNNFAEIVLSSIAGTVFMDQNDNGIQNAADTALAGVTLELLNGASVVVATTTTDSSGNYSFAGLSPGTYSVREPTQPANTANGKTVAGTMSNGGTAGTPTAQNVLPSIIGSIVLPPNTASTANNFAEVPAGRQVSGRVFVDNNNDGVFNGSDIGIAGQLLNLTGTDFNGFAVTRSISTTSDGRYVFAGLAEGTYTVTEPSQPPSTLNGLTVVGSTGGLASAVFIVPSVVSSVSLTGFNLISSDNNFAEIAAPAGNSAVTGHVYVDKNDNGAFEAGEVGIGGVSMTLTGTSTAGVAVSVTVLTAADGSYAFENLQPSSAAGYTVTETQPSAYSDGKTTVSALYPGQPLSAKPVASGMPDVIGKIYLGPLERLIDYNFGEHAATNTISGYVYVDANDNGVKNADEAGIGGVPVTLTGTDNNGLAVSLSTSTAIDGSYSFGNLQPSNAAGYTITETQPSAYGDGKTSIASGNPGTLAGTPKPIASGTADVITGVVLPAGAALVDYNFGELPSTNSIAGFVYADTNNNGAMDGGEAGIAGVLVTLSGVDFKGAPVSVSMSTAADGSFIFGNLQPSGAAGYTLTETQPPAYKDGKTSIIGSPGTASGSKPVAVGNTDVITSIKLYSGDRLTGYLYGEIAVPFLKPPIINGYVWLDRNHSRTRPRDGTQSGQPGWTVVLRQNGKLICTTTTDANGFYQFDNLHCPGYEVSGLPIGSGFSITFTKDGNNLPNVPVSGDNRGQVPTTGGQIVNITLLPSDTVVEQNLPLDPAGVVYDSVTRKPVGGATVVISGPAGFDPATHLVGGMSALTQVTGTDGMYQFLLQNDFPSGTYTLTVTAPAGYLPAPSTSLPACAGTVSVGLVPSPAMVQSGDFAPALSVTQQLNPNTCIGFVPGGAATTQYYFKFSVTNGGSAPILNNHIPLDPVLAGAMLVTKTTPVVNVAHGDSVPYTITATNLLPKALGNIGVRDQMPPGFKYRRGSATVNGVPAEPTVSGNTLTWSGMNFAPSEKKIFKLILMVGSGVGDGEYVNKAWALSGLSSTVLITDLSNLATATVHLVPDPTFDCPDVIGKVFDDRNANGYQDQGEPGIPAVRLATVRGLLVTTDADGRFHVPCPDIPNADRGSNFVMKLDDRTLPSGYRVTTENPRDVRITRGKVVKINFGATIHRVVRLELADAAFEAGSEKLLPAWQEKIDALPEQLKGKPSVVRIAYQRATETKELMDKRIAAIRDDIRKRWATLKGEYTLVIEIEGAQ